LKDRGSQEITKKNGGFAWLIYNLEVGLVLISQLTRINELKFTQSKNY
jgi:hypothetical protein